MRDDPPNLEAEAGLLQWKKLEDDLASCQAAVVATALGPPKLRLLKLKLEFAI